VLLFEKMEGTVRETKTLDLQAFADFITSRLDRLDGRLKGIHFVLNAICNEMRNQDESFALSIADFMERMALSDAPSTYTKEIVEMYSGVLRHGTVEPGDLQ
jgi:hypothetical protein